MFLSLRIPGLMGQGTLPCLGLMRVDAAISSAISQIRLARDRRGPLLHDCLLPPGSCRHSSPRLSPQSGWFQPPSWAEPTTRDRRNALGARCEQTSPPIPASVLDFSASSSHLDRSSPVAGKNRNSFGIKAGRVIGMDGTAVISPSAAVADSHAGRWARSGRCP